MVLRCSTTCRYEFKQDFSHVKVYVRRFGRVFLGPFAPICVAAVVITATVAGCMQNCAASSASHCVAYHRPRL